MSTHAPAVLLAGVSGLVGHALLTQLMGEDRAQVHALVRRDVPGLPHSGLLTLHRVNFARIGGLPRADELYIALGTTLKMAGSREAFRAVDFDTVVALARTARASGVARCAVVSALGADASSRVFYNRVKGEMEKALRELQFERLVIARPSLLAGKRAALGQPMRWGEQIALTALAPVTSWLPASIRPIEAATVARAMRVGLRQHGPAVQVLESALLQSMGSEKA